MPLSISWPPSLHSLPSQLDPRQLSSSCDEARTRHYYRRTEVTHAEVRRSRFRVFWRFDLIRLGYLTRNRRITPERPGALGGRPFPPETLEDAGRRQVGRVDLRARSHSGQHLHRPTPLPTTFRVHGHPRFLAGARGSFENPDRIRPSVGGCVGGLCIHRIDRSHDYEGSETGRVIPCARVELHGGINKSSRARQ